MNDNLFGHKTAINFLLLVTALLSSSLQSAIAANAFALDPTELYVKKQVNGASGIYKLLDSNSKQLDGVCSFNSDGRLDSNRAAIWNRITLYYGVGNVGIPGAVDYSTALPVSLQNADIVISQDGVQIYRASVRSIISKGAETKTGDNYKELDSLRLFRDDREVQINLHFAEGATALPAAGLGTTPYIYVSIDALTTRKK